MKTLFLAPVSFEDILRCNLIAQIAQDPLPSSPQFFSILFPFWLENTPDDLALIGVFGHLEIDPARAFIFLPPLGSILEMTSWQSSILEDLLSQRPVSSGILETSRSMLTCARSEPYRLYEVTQNTGRCLMNMRECA